MTHLLLVLLSMRPDIVQMTPEAIDVGGRVVAAEARGESFVSQVNVASVIGERVRCDRSRWKRERGVNPWVGVMTAPSQFAAMAPRSVTRPSHQLAFIVGGLMPIGWRRGAVMFATPAAVRDKSLKEKWGPEFVLIEEADDPAHQFFRRGKRDG